MKHASKCWMMIGLEKAGKIVRFMDEYCLGKFPINVVTAASSFTGKQRTFGNFLKEHFSKIPELSE